MSDSQTAIFPAKVVEVVDEYKVVVNRGAQHVRKGQRFIIYTLGKELFDPDSKEGLGRLELVRGTGVVTHVQERVCTISSDQRTTSTRRTIRRQDPYSSFSSRDQEVVEEPGHLLPFEEVAVGDFAKPI